MIILRLLFKEISHRKLNFVLAILAVIVSVALYVAFETTGKAMEDETRKLMLELGQNLRIIPKETRIDQFWIRGFSESTMPQDYVYRFIEKGGYSYTHLTATLQRTIQWKGFTVLITGVMPEVFPPDKPHTEPMTFELEQGNAYVGFEVADSLNIQEGDEIEINGTRLHVVKTLYRTGSYDDVRIYTELSDAQRIFGLPGRINEIKALECICFLDYNTDPLKAVQDQLTELLPEGKVLLLRGIADIRFQQRTTTAKHMSFIMISIMVGCGVFIGVLAMLNVRAREREIGLLRALGYGGAGIAVLLLGKALLIGVIGAFLGFLGGTRLALTYGPQIFQRTAKAIRIDYTVLAEALLWAPAFAVVCSFIPAMQAVASDPAYTLREDQ